MSAPPPPTPVLTFTATIELLPGCYECRTTALRLTAEALEQRGMASMTLRTGKRHNHTVVEEAAPSLPSMEGKLFDLPRSDVNGFDPEGRDE